MMKEVTKGAIIRTVVLVVALINQGLTMAGYSPLPFADAEITEVLSYAFTAAAALIAWWKNNSFTKPAIEADKVLKQLKTGR